MVTGASPPEIARAVIDTNRYLVLATADRTGTPWSSPVYFAHRGFREFFWVSAPEAAHSRNIAVRPQVGIVVFDSSVPIGCGQGVYLSAVAAVVEGPDTDAAIEVFSRRSVIHGGRCGRPATYRSPPACGSTARWPRTTPSSPRTDDRTTASRSASPDALGTGAAHRPGEESGMCGRGTAL